MMKGQERFSYVETLEELGLFSLEKAQRGSYQHIPDGREERRRRQALFNSAFWQDKRQRAQIAKREMKSEHKKKLSDCNGGQERQPETAYRNCGISTLGVHLKGHILGNVLCVQPLSINQEGLDSMISKVPSYLSDSVKCPERDLSLKR